MRAPLLLAGVATALLAGCGQGTVARLASSPSATPPTAPVGATQSASPSPVWTSYAEPTSTPDPLFGVCPAHSSLPPPPGVPDDAVCVTWTRGNFDGASPSEMLVAYTLRGPALAERTSKLAPAPLWYVRVELAFGRVITADLKTFFPLTSEASVIGAADARGDGQDEAFVVLLQGASTGFVGILGIDHGQLMLASTPAGPGVFAVGGSAMHQGMLQCLGRGAAARLLVSGWGSNDGGKTFDWESITYAWAGMRLYPVSSQKGTVSSIDDPQLKALANGPNCLPGS